MRHHAIAALDRRLAMGRATFTSRELREELAISPQATSNLLGRWYRAGLVDRVARGRYAIRQIGLLGTRAASEDVSLAVAALVGDTPHRIAYHTALDFHGLLTRPMRTVQVASPRRLNTVSGISGHPLQIISEREETVGVGAEPAGHGALVSGIERSLLDSASRPDLVGGYFPLAEALSGSHPDAARLLDLADRLEARAALRRIGSLADRLGLQTLASELHHRGRSDFAFDLDLDPQLKHLGTAFRDKRWRVRWPAHPDAVEQELAY
jgi:predicted transcriptional regulator of viral defense system